MMVNGFKETKTVKEFIMMRQLKLYTKANGKMGKKMDSEF